MKSTGQQKVIIAIMLGIFLVFLGRLFYIQVLTDSYSIWAQQNAIRKVTVYPARGIIYDRNRERVVVNRPIYDLMVIPRQVDKQLDTLEFCKLLGISQTSFEERMSQAARYSRFRASLFQPQISVESFAAIQERLHEFPGFYPESRTVRAYPYASAAHILGYIGEVNDRQIRESEGYYQMGDYIGIAGIELSYEKFLRGKRGVKYQYVDVHNRIVGSYKDGAFDSMAVSGEELELSVDIALQNYAEQLFANKKGSVVAIEPATGEILAFVSAPGYDPNLLVGSVRGVNYRALVNNPLKPLFNRPLQAQYPPGSIFKPLQALIGQELGLLKPGTRFPCGGGYRMGSHTVKCTHVHTALNLEESIQFSCNPYYCWSFKTMVDHQPGKTPAEGYAIWKEFMNRFTIGERTGIDIPNEVKGILPSVDYYNRIHGQGRWRANSIISLSIGQGEVSITPLQMANSMAIIANKGWYIPPHLVRGVGPNHQLDSQYQQKQHTGISEFYFDVVIEAMQKVVDAGTARAYGRLDSITICGKTGTAQNPHGKDHAVFVCFAPRENPKIALAVLVENAGFGGVWAAPIASLMIEKYLLGGTTRTALEQRILEAHIP
jgi:penicillin-binding protein 2